MKSKSININDNPQPSDDFQKKGLSNCQENMFDSLINKLTPTRFEAGKDGDINSSQSLISLKTEDYPEIPTSKYISEKIRELKYLTQSIEKKSGGKHPDTKIDFSNYSVDYLSELNSAQLVSVTTTEGPLLVIAGAGTGKTRVIVFRVSFLIESGVDPQSILLLTFTRKSAKEMIDRVETLLNNENVGMITGGTFHSFANHILRKYSRLIGLPPDFTIIDTADSEDIIDLLRSELKFVTKDRRFPRKSRVYDIISYSRNKQLTIEQIINQDYTGLIDFIKDIESLLIAYTKYKRASHLLDFDDLLEVLCDALKENNQFKEIMQDKYKYIMVDEFQDTNVIQNEIVNILAGNHRRIMVVGDDAQSIYSFRGANYENILRFPEMYADCSVIKIEENFRSNDKILNFTNSIIDNAQIRYKKNLFTKHISNHLPIVKAIYGQEEEAKFIVDSISELLERGISLNQIAVLNRADWHNRFKWN